MIVNKWYVILERGGNFLLIQLIAKTTKQTLLESKGYIKF
jgi:hypothetical protein